MSEPKRIRKSDPIEPRPRAVPAPKVREPKSGPSKPITFKRGETSPTPVTRVNNPAGGN